MYHHINVLDSEVIWLTEKAESASWFLVIATAIKWFVDNTNEVVGSQWGKVLFNVWSGKPSWFRALGNGRKRLSQRWLPFSSLLYFNTSILNLYLLLDFSATTRMTTTYPTLSRCASIPISAIRQVPSCTVDLSSPSISQSRCFLRNSRQQDETGHDSFYIVLESPIIRATPNRSRKCRTQAEVAALARGNSVSGYILTILWRLRHNDRTVSYHKKTWETGDLPLR